jgi:hypothetical protein
MPDPKFKEGERVKFTFPQLVGRSGYGTVKKFHGYVNDIYSVVADDRHDVIFCYEEELENLDA